MLYCAYVAPTLLLLANAGTTLPRLQHSHTSEIVLTCSQALILTAAVAACAGPSQKGKPAPKKGGKKKKASRASDAAAARGRAISSTGHTCRGRVKGKSTKKADLVSVGMLWPKRGW